MAENLHPLVHVLCPHNMQVSRMGGRMPPTWASIRCLPRGISWKLYVKCDSCCLNWHCSVGCRLNMLRHKACPAHDAVYNVAIQYSVSQDTGSWTCPTYRRLFTHWFVPCCTQTLLGQVREIVYGKAWSKFHKGQWKRGRCWQCCLGSAKHVSGLQGGLVPGVWHGVSQMQHSYWPKQVLSSATISAWLLCLYIYIFKFSQVVLSFLVLWKFLFKEMLERNRDTGLGWERFWLGQFASLDHAMGLVVLGVWI